MDGHPAEPEVALALARADDEVGGGALGERSVADELLDPALRARWACGDRLEHLDHDRVVQVEHQPDRHAGEPAEQRRRQLLRDQHLVRARRRDESVEVLHARLDQAHSGVGRAAGRRRGQRHVVLRREGTRQLGGADRRTRHSLADGLRRQDQDGGPHARSSFRMRRSTPPSAHRHTA